MLSFEYVHSYRHIYISPHFDDAALSCGGSIHQQCRMGDAVLVVTVFAAHPEPDTPLSALARELHARMGNPADVVGTRRNEDRTALAILGADGLWLEFVDAIYRRDGERWLYPQVKDLFGHVHSRDATLAREIVDALVREVRDVGAATVHAPLGLGRHVDHQLASQAGRLLDEQGMAVLFYEDFPYCESNEVQPGAADSPGPDARQTRQPEIRHLAEEDLQARIQSVHAYASQIGLVLGDRARAEARIRAYAARFDTRQPAERFWASPPSSVQAAIPPRPASQ